MDHFLLLELLCLFSSIAEARHRNSPGNVTKILVMAYPRLVKYKLISRVSVALHFDFRTGSSFTGQILSAYPDAFYVFEPLYHKGLTLYDYKRQKAENVQDLLKDIFACKKVPRFFLFLEPMSPNRILTSRIPVLYPLLGKGKICKAILIKIVAG